jgi:hypothetical protein
MDEVKDPIESFKVCIYSSNSSYHVYYLLDFL